MHFLLPYPIIWPMKKTKFYSAIGQYRELKMRRRLCATFVFSYRRKQGEDTYALNIIEDITHCRAKGYDWEDMAILVRTRKQAQSIGAVAFASKSPFSSSESLVLKQSISVNFFDDAGLFKNASQRFTAEKSTLLSCLKASTIWLNSTIICIEI